MATASSLTITLRAPFAAQDRILRDKTRFRVLAIGRRWGKTELAIIACLMRLLRGQRIWFCSPTTANNKRVWPKFKAALRDIPGAYVNNSDYLITLPNGGYIKFVSLHEPDNIRGEGLDFLVVDEAAFIAEDTWDKILRPMIAIPPGDAMILSSPNGRNWFWRAYQRGLDANEPDWVSYHYTTPDSPFMQVGEWEDIQRNTPARAVQQEYLAEFLEDGGAVFRNISACVVEAPAQAQHVVFGVDWGRHHDYTVIVAIDTVSGRVLEIDRFNQVDWLLQRGRLEAMAERWQPALILAESNSIGEPNIEELRRAKLPVQSFTTTAASKQQVINALALAFEQQDIGILNDSTLIAELQAYTIERLPSGNLRYTAPAGTHDDMVIALALAWHGVTHKPVPAKVHNNPFYG